MARAEISPEMFAEWRVAGGGWRVAGGGWRVVVAGCVLRMISEAAAVAGASAGAAR